MAGLEDYNNLTEYQLQQKDDYWDEKYYRKLNLKGEEFNLYQTPIPIPAEQNSPDDDPDVKKYVGISVGLVSLITENLLSHPFVVLRRQCQVHSSSKRYHLVPITLIPVIVHLHQRQGITTLWKGIGSVLLVRGMTLAVEDLISKITPWPKEINIHSSMKAVGQHILLKCISLSIVTPFYSASLVETVQSDIASEKPGVLDVFKEGAMRLVSWGAPQKGRMLPIWALVVPSVTLGITKYIFSLIVQGASNRIMYIKRKREQERQGALSKDLLSQSITQEIELNSTLIATIAADIVFYPCETILHRLCLQGTRTIVDNLDSGYAVLPILTGYECASDCYEKTLASEGFFGFYKGFGALILQFAAHIAVVRLTKFILTEISVLMRSSKTEASKIPNQVSPYPNPYAPNETYLIP